MVIFKILSLKHKRHRILIELNNKVEFVSKDYSSRVECLKMINVIRRNSIIEQAYEIQKLDCGSWFFVLNDITKGHLIGRSSETYIEKKTVENKAKLMKIEMPKAKLDNRLYTM